MFNRSHSIQLTILCVLFSLFETGAVNISTSTNGLLGLKDNGKWIVSPVFKKVRAKSEHSFILTDNDLTDAVYSNDGKCIISLSDKFGFIKEHIIGGKPFYEVTTRYGLRCEGLIGADGQIKIPPIYKYISLLKDGNIWVKTFDNKCGLLTPEGECLIDVRYSDIKYINKIPSRPYYLTSINNFEGIIDAEFCPIIRCNSFYKITQSPNAKGFIVYHENHAGFIDNKGKTIIAPNKYTSLYWAKGSFFCVFIGNRAGVCDLDGKERFMTDFNSIVYRESNGNGYFEVEYGNAKGKLDLNGKIIEMPKSELKEEKKIFGGIQYIVIHTSNGLKGIKTLSGTVIIPPIYDFITFLDKCNAWKCSHDGYFSLYDKEGTPIIKDSYKISSISYFPFHSDYFLMRKDNKTGLINKSLGTIFELMDFDNIIPIKLNNGYINEYIVEKNGLCGIINKEGRPIIPIKYHSIHKDKDGRGYYVTLNGLNGFCDNKGKEIAAAAYTTLSISDGILSGPYDWIISVKDGEKSGYIKNNGEIIFSPTLYECVVISRDTEDLYPGEEYYFCAWNKSKGESPRDGTHYALGGKVLGAAKTIYDFERYQEHASALFSTGDYKKAYNQYKAASKLFETCFVEFNMGICKYNVSDYTNAIKHFKKALTLHPTENIKTKSYELIRESEQCNSVKQQQKASNILAIINLGLGIANDIYQMNNARKYSPMQSVQSTQTDALSERNSYKDEGESSLKTSKAKSKCGACGGRGTTIEYTANYGIKKDFYCDECGKTVTNGHYHRTCTMCGGSGLR